MTHLSSEQISGWLLGECDLIAQRHVENCLQCHDDIVQLRDSLQIFKQSVHQWADHSQSQNLPAPEPTSSVSWTLAAAAAVAMSLALLPLYLDVRQVQLDAARAQDSLLMDQVHARITQAVPQSMERLMELMIEGKEAQQ